MTADLFGWWLDRAKPGARLAYYRGHLAMDREDPAHAALADAAMQASEAGWVTLTQRRLGEDLYIYYATRTSEILG